MLDLITKSKHPQHIIVVPSRDLCVELKAKLEGYNVPTVIINSDTHKNTTLSIVTYLNTFEYIGTKQVVIITHASFRLMDISSTDGWHVWHDELPTLFEGTKVWYDENVNFDDYFVVNPDKSITLTKRSLATSNHDGLNSELKGLIHGLKTGRFDAYAVNREKESSGKQYMSVMTIIRPEYFPENTTLLSAGIEDSMVYKMLKNRNAIGTNTVLKTNLLNHYSDKIEIVYAMDNFNTRYLRETYPEEFTAAVDALCGIVRGKCIVVANDEVKVPEKFDRLTHNVHGMNKYTSYNNAMFLSALNIDPESMGLLQDVLGVTPEEVYLDRTVSIAYQVVMRGSLRLSKEVDTFKIFVMEARLADALKTTYFPNATVTGMVGYNVKLKVRGRPKAKVEPLTTEQRKKAFNMRKFAKAGKYAPMDNIRILNAKGREIMKLGIWERTNHLGKEKA